MSEWRRFYRCDECGHVESLIIDFQQKIFLPTACPDCGELTSYNYSDAGVGKYVWGGKWYLPWTWFRRKVVDRNGELLLEEEDDDKSK